MPGNALQIKVIKRDVEIFRQQKKKRSSRWNILWRNRIISFDNTRYGVVHFSFLTRYAKGHYSIFTR